MTPLSTKKPVTDTKASRWGMNTAAYCQLSLSSVLTGLESTWISTTSRQNATFSQDSSGLRFIAPATFFSRYFLGVSAWVPPI